MNRRTAFAVILISSLINPLISAAVNVALPSIGHEFGFSTAALSWVSLSFLLASAALLLPLGRFADLNGQRNVFLTGTILIAFSALGAAIAPDGAVLIAFRVFQGFGSAMVFGTGMAIVTSLFEPKDRGKMIGINVTSVYLGLTLAPLIGGFLTDSFGWRSIFFTTIPVSMITAILGFWALPKDRKLVRKNPFDFVGTALYIPAITLSVFGFSQLPHLHAAVLLTIGIVLLILFAKQQLKVDYPLLDLRLLFGNKPFALANAAAFINYAATFALTFMLSLLLQYAYGLSPRSAGMWLLVPSICMMVTAPLAGKLSDKIDPGIPASIGMGMTGIGLLILTVLPAGFHLNLMLFPMAIIGIGLGLFSSPNTNAIMSGVEKRFLGVASALVSTMRVTGQAVSMGIAALVIHAVLGSSQVTTETLPQFYLAARIVLGGSAVICGFGVFASMARIQLKS